LKNEFEVDTKNQNSSDMNSPQYSDSNESSTFYQQPSAEQKAEQQPNTIEYEQKDLDFYEKFDFEDSLKAKKHVLIISKSVSDPTDKPGIFD
jgi:hypothetical protein